MKLYLHWWVVTISMFAVQIVKCSILKAGACTNIAQVCKKSILQTDHDLQSCDCHCQKLSELGPVLPLLLLPIIWYIRLTRNWWISEWPQIYRGVINIICWLLCTMLASPDTGVCLSVQTVIRSSADLKAGSLWSGGATLVRRNAFSTTTSSFLSPDQKFP